MAGKRAFVYILKCADRTFYIGIAREVAKRIAVHNARKGAKYTRARLPVRMVYQEGPMSLTKALQREYQLKQLSRSQKKAFIAGKLIIQAPRGKSRKRQASAKSKARSTPAQKSVPVNVGRT